MLVSTSVALGHGHSLEIEEGALLAVGSLVGEAVIRNKQRV